MRIRGLGLAAPFVLLVACAEKTTTPASAPVPHAVVVQPSAAERQPSSPPAPARPSTPPVVVTPSPAGPAPSPTPPAETPSSERAGAILYIAVQRANFRQTPDLKARILAVLTKGTKLTVIEKSAQWYRVRLDDGKEGWVAESVTSTKPD